MLVGIYWQDDGWDIRSSMEELAQLAETAGLQVVGAVSQRLDHPNGKYYVGAGKLAEIKRLREQLLYDVVLVNDELSPAQLRNLEDELQVKVLDRTALILDIFARRAQTHEGRLQVELAQLEYRLPRLTRMWTHLSRQAVGGVGLRGPGETQLEVDRRQARQRIALLRRQLAEVHQHRERYRQRRRQNQIPVIALVGYTNAGKSTLLNALAGSHVLAEDKLFATLDPTTRRITLPSGREVLVTDTVGFIHKLPTMLVAAFRATLEEILEAHLVLHVLDITHPKAAEQAATVSTVLAELGAEHYPTLTVLNKIDRLGEAVDPIQLAQELGLQPDVVPVSALTGAGLSLLRQRIEETLAGIEQLTPVSVLVPFHASDLVALFHERGQVEEIAYQHNGVHIRGRLPAYLAPRFAQYSQSPSVRGSTLRIENRFR